ncbi:MAG: RAD55 family ATPase [Nitrososphaerales archaeon]
MLDILTHVITCASIGIVIVAPFLTVLLLSRRIERISGVRSYWHLFLFSIIFYVIHVIVEWGDLLGIFTVEPFTLLFLITSTLLLSSLSVALAMMGLMSMIGYRANKIFLTFTSMGVIIPILLSLSLNYMTTPLLSFPMAVLILLQGFLMWCYISFSYLSLSKLISILVKVKIHFILMASVISLVAGLGFLFYVGISIFGFSSFASDIELALRTFTQTAVGLMALYSSLKLFSATKPLSKIPIEAKLETGIPEIDDMLKGGIPHPSSILLLGVVGSGKTEIFLKLSCYRLEKGDAIVFVCTNNLPENYRIMMKNFGFDPKPFEERNSLIFIDAYSKEFGLKSKEKYSISMMPYDISIAISKAMEEAKGTNKIIIIHNLTNILDVYGAKEGLTFLRNIVAKTREAKATLLLSLNPQAFPPAVLALTQEAVDGNMELKVGKKVRYRGVLNGGWHNRDKGKEKRKA